MPVKKSYNKNKNVVSKSYPTSIGTTSYLVIVESPSKCTKIEGYLGPKYKCIASKGHIRELVGLKSIAVNSNYEPTFTIIKEKASHVSWMKDIIKQYPKESIYVATDDDREGEGIAWHIMMLFKLPLESTKRILFHEITKKAIMDAISNAQFINMNLVKAQQARQILDIIVGFKISPHLWKHVRGGKDNALSAGRCQTPALRLIYDREKEIADHPIEMKYKITGTFTSQKLLFSLNQETADKMEIETFLENSKTFQHVLEIKDAKKSIRQPPRPFHTSSLIQTSSNILHMSPKITMQTAQKLYQSGLITYMRTENAKYAEPFVETVRKYILEKYTETYIGDLEKITNTDTKNPHEGIRVTNIGTRTLDALEGKEKSLYQLIWRNTLESCMSAATYQVIPLVITAPTLGKRVSLYKHNLEIPIFLGWKIVKGEKDNDEGTYMYIKTLYGSDQTTIPYQKIESEVAARNKISHYTESSLVQKLEDLGIGRPSTFATLVETIQDRDYVKSGDITGNTVKCTNFVLHSTKILEKQEVEKVLGGEKDKLYILPVGILCMEFLLKYFEKLFDYDYTKNMEYDLDRISNGSEEKSWYEICNDCANEITSLSKNLGKVEKDAYMIDKEHEISFQQYGPCIKHTSQDNVITYLPINENIEISLEKARNGEYKLNDVLAFEKENIGMYKDHYIKIKKGKYGSYLENGDNKYNLKKYTGNLAAITLKDAIEYIESQSHENVSKGIILNNDMSIRHGKYGAYVYYKTSEMKTPKFLSLKNFNHVSKDPVEIVEWITEKYLS
jgi:DNA topoisomerase-1